MEFSIMFRLLKIILENLIYKKIIKNYIIQDITLISIIMKLRY